MINTQQPSGKPGQAPESTAELLLSGDQQAFAQHKGLLSDLAGVCRNLGDDVAAASVLYTAVWSYDFASRFAYMEAAALVTASGLDLEDFTKSAALRTAQFPEQNAELSDRFTRNHFDGDQASVDIYAEGVPPMMGAFSAVGLKALLLEGVGRYSDAAEHAGYGQKDVSVIYDMIRSRKL